VSKLRRGLRPLPGRELRLLPASVPPGRGKVGHHTTIYSGTLETRVVSYLSLLWGARGVGAMNINKAVMHADECAALSTLGESTVSTLQGLSTRVDEPLAQVRRWCSYRTCHPTQLTDSTHSPTHTRTRETSDVMWHSDGAYGVAVLGLRQMGLHTISDMGCWLQFKRAKAIVVRVPPLSPRDVVLLRPAASLAICPSPCRDESRCSLSAAARVSRVESWLTRVGSCAARTLWMSAVTVAHRRA
jgi:hypothetical protein